MEDRKRETWNTHPIDTVCEGVAAHRQGGSQYERYLANRMKDESFAKHYAAEQERIRRMQTPIAYITRHGDLMCATCLQPTLEQIESELLSITCTTAGKAEPCDGCGTIIQGAEL
jgi:hypothetical protein